MKNVTVEIPIETAMMIAEVLKLQANEFKQDGECLIRMTNDDNDVTANHHLRCANACLTTAQVISQAHTEAEAQNAYEAKILAENLAAEATKARKILLGEMATMKFS